MSNPYTALPGPSTPPLHADTHAIRLDDSPPAPTRLSLESDSDESDIIYRDVLDVEPFDEKRDRRFKDEGVMEDGQEGGDGDGQGYVTEPRRLRPRKRSKRVLAALIGILVLAGLIGAFAGTVYSVPTHLVTSGKKHITMDHIFNGTFAVTTKTLDWVKEAPDGTFSRLTDEGNIVLSTVSNMSDWTVLVNAEKVVDLEGRKLEWQTWRLSPDGKYVLFRTDSTQQWRHSSRGNYWVHRLSDSRTYPITTLSQPAKIAIAVWAPVGHALAYVMDNDLYILLGEEVAKAKPEAIRVTEDGSATVFNGVPDWVYEEEVYGTDSILWWSPDGKTVAYLRSDETDVRDYRLQYYNPSNDAFEVHQYPTELDMKYPKPGTPNPLVSVHTFSLSTYEISQSISRSKAELSWDGALPLPERIISEVAWVDETTLLVKETDRAARKGNVVVFQRSSEGIVIRKLGGEGEEGDKGWIEVGQNVRLIRGQMTGYLDIIPKDGYNNIAFFSPANASEPIWITESDQGEVTQIAGVDEEQGLIYYIAARPSIDRHLFSAVLPTVSDLTGYSPGLKALTDVSVGGYHEVSFSPGGRYYVLQYKGPDVPWQKVVEAGNDDSAQLLEGNHGLNKTLSEFARPIISRTTLESDGYTLNMLEMMPSTLDTSGRKKYPVLIRVYGGPGSQTVSNKWERDWHTYLVTEKKYIVIMVDGRGTGFAGRKLRNPVRDDLGHWEVVDQIAAARDAAKRVYVDTSRIGIWGWSYGGYMTCKTLEADSGIISLGMAVAPVTNWLYYDSIYTERYMSTPGANQAGYIQSAVNNVTAFGKVDFLLAHGSGDDNVHYLNSASLVDKLTQEQVRGWRFRMFTDSNHAMNKRGAYREVYEWMTAFLDEKWGRGGTVKHG